MTTDSIQFDLAKFRLLYPQFSAVSDEVIEMQWDMATCYISACNYGWMHGKCRQQALNLLTAHLVQQNLYAQDGELTGQLNSATIDKVSVTLNAPPNPNQWQFYLGQTPYGQQLMALLSSFAVGGFSVGDVPELTAFRRAYGVFV